MLLIAFYKREFLKDNRCGTKHPHEKITTQNKLRQEKSGVMYSSFPRGGRDSTLLSEDIPHEVSESGHGGGRDSSTSVSH